MRSIMDNADPSLPLHFHLFLTPGVPTHHREKLVRTVREGGRWAEIAVGSFDPARWRHLARSKLITHTAYASCLLQELLPPRVDRCIYVDCDLAVERDIVELWSKDLQGSTAGAILNGSLEDSADHQRRLDLSEPRYFNSGVLLLDMDRWRKRKVGPRAMEAAERMGPRLILHDQDALNCALDGDWIPLEPHWNVWVILPELQAHHRAVFHYMGAPKPWHADYDRPFPEHFFRYLDRTPYRGWRPWNPAGLGAGLTRLRRRLPSAPGIARALKLRLHGAAEGAPETQPEGQPR